MYGTVAKLRVRPENREALRSVVDAQNVAGVDGYVASHTLFENDTDVAWLFAIFQDRAAYDANANDPAQHERYLQIRALLEDDPEWHDGDIESM